MLLREKKRRQRANFKVEFSCSDRGSHDKTFILISFFFFRNENKVKDLILLLKRPPLKSLLNFFSVLFLFFVSFFIFFFYFVTVVSFSHIRLLVHFYYRKNEYLRFETTTGHTYHMIYSSLAIV